MTDRREPNDPTGGWPSAASQHPGFDNYPPRHVPTRRQPLPPLHPVDPPRQPDRGGEPAYNDDSQPPPAPAPTRGMRQPRKLTVTRVAAMRGRELTGRGFATFQRAAKADGAEKSGLTALTYATMANFATDAAIAIALANTLFFSAAQGESQLKVALYLAITIAPFAVIAPLIGPMLDRLQHGRRVALASSFGLRAALAVVLVFNFDSWLLYPAALGILVLSKSFSVLKSAVTPRVLPPEIDLVRVNSRLTVFGLLGGTIGAGALAGIAAIIADSAGALWFAFVLSVAGAYLSMRIPAWVEVTEGEVPATLTYHGDSDYSAPIDDPDRGDSIKPSKRRQPLGRAVVTGLWGNSTIRVLTGFLTLFVAFVARSRSEHEPLVQAAMLGLVGVAAGLGNFSGNAIGARLSLGRPALLVVRCTIAVTVITIVAAFVDSLVAAAVVALVASAASALAKVSLDAAIQDDLPPESIASAFGRSETALQLSWVVGGALGVLLPTKFWLGFTVISVLLALGTVQTIVSYTGHSLLPGLGGNRPDRAKQEVKKGFGSRVGGRSFKRSATPSAAAAGTARQSPQPSTQASTQPPTGNAHW